MILGPEAGWCNGRGGPIVVGMPSQEKRDAVFQRHDFRCVYCGEEFPAEELTVDHVEPRVKGGDHSKGNLVAACWPCNREKGGAPAWAYLADRPGKRANFLRLARFVWPRLRAAVEEAADTAAES